MIDLEYLKALHGETLVHKELELEESYKALAESIFKANLDKLKGMGEASSTKTGQRYIDHKLDDVLYNIECLLKDIEMPKRGVKSKYHGIIMELLDIYKEDREGLKVMLGLIAFQTLVNGAFTVGHRQGSATLSARAEVIIREIQEEAKLQAFINLNPDIEQSINRGMKQRIQKHYKIFYARQRMKHEEFKWSHWDVGEGIALGAKLIELVMAATGYFEEHKDITQKGTNILEIRPNQELLDAWKSTEDKTLSKVFKLVPMVIPPQPWESHTIGGYWGALSGNSTLLRSHPMGVNKFQLDYVQRLNQLELTEVREAVNSIQATPWVINKKVLKVAQQIIARGGNMAGIPLMDALPELPDLPEGCTAEQLKEHKQKKADRYRLDGRRLSKAYRVRSHIAIAKEYQAFDKIYFPWNMDFRGRCYPMPMFSPQGDDLNKSLILFADAPPCEDYEDIDWLMVHGANLAGVDKVSFLERKKWVLTNESYILATANDPMSNIEWWGNLDSPMQFLAWCLEWQAWKQWEQDKGTPKGFISGIPIAFDGTCSGLQHFSAILRDPIGGQAVNLIPSETPQDIYKVVAEKVNEILKVDALRGTTDEVKDGDYGQYTKYGTKHLAQEWLAFGVDRKVTKRSVMTLAYGSKEYGFKEQILEDTIEPALLESSGVKPWINPSQAAGYLAKLIWKVVGQVVVKAVEGMKWLQDMAKLVCKSGNVVMWETPMGLPIQQSYLEFNVVTHRLRFAGEFKRLYHTEATGNIHKRHQANGIAPNFIHSMDAAHLQLTILKAKAEGIKHCAMIHDSYGAPVAQAKTMFKVVREAFVELYSENDVLENFKRDMIVYIDKLENIPKIPAKGSLDLEVVKQSLYTFH